MEEIRFYTDDILTFTLLYNSLRREFDREREIETRLKEKLEQGAFSIYAAEIYSLL